MTLAITAHGTIVAVQLTPGGAFTDIAEIGDVDYPGLSRNEFDATTQNINIDAYVLGVMRRDGLPLALNFLPSNNTHDHLTGLQYLMINNTVTGFRLSPPNSLPVWVMSGQVQSFKPKAPVDGKLAVDAVIRLSGVMSIGGVSVGA